MELFQWENVLGLASPPKEKGKQIGPSNLSATVHILRQAGMWTHCWQLFSDDFGSAQCRGRLWGSCFQLDDLHMPEEQAHSVLDSVMSYLMNVEVCDADEYLLSENDPEVVAQRGSAAALASAASAGVSVGIAQLFDTGGVMKVSNEQKRRRLARTSSSPDKQDKWMRLHDEFFAKLGEDHAVGMSMSMPVE